MPEALFELIKDFGIFRVESIVIEKQKPATKNKPKKKSGTAAKSSIIASKKKRD